MRLRHVLFAAASPLCLLAGAAQAETVISTTVATPVATATAANGARDDVKISTAGTIQPTSAGAAVTLNSNNTVTNEGTIKFSNVNDATGILGLGGMTGTIKHAGTMTIDETTEIKDGDGDGDLDGPFATGARRYGIRVTGPGAFHGDVIQSGGSITMP